MVVQPGTASDETSARPRQAAAAALPVNIHGGGRDGLGDIGGAAAGLQQAAAAALPVNELDGGRDGLDGHRWSSSGSAAGSSSGAAAERPRWGPGRPG